MRRFKPKTRAFELLLISVLFIACIAFSSGAVDINVGVYDGTAYSEGGGPVPTDTIFLWKVTVYKANNSSAQKTSDLSNFDNLGTKFMCRERKSYRGGSTSLYGANPYNYLPGGDHSIRIGLTDKLTYAYKYINGEDIHNSTVHRTRLLQWEDLLVWDNSLPLFDMDNTASSHEEEVKRFFGNNAYRIAKEIAGDKVGDENGTWFIIFEPTTHAYIQAAGRAAFTPTQYAVAQNYSQKAGGFNSYLAGQNGNYGYAGAISIHNASSAAVIVDGTYLSLDKNANWGIHHSWTKSENGQKFVYAMNHWGEVRDAVIRFGGAGIVFSKAFDLPDYTVDANALGEKWECETDTITSNVYNSNPVNGDSVTVKLTMENPQKDIKIDNVTQTVNPIVMTKTLNMKDKERDTVSWSVNVGTYAQTLDARVRKYSVTVEAEPDKELQTDNNSSGEKTMTLKRDFAISEVQINGSASTVRESIVRVKENTTVTVSFDVKNKNDHRTYDNVPISVYLYRASVNRYIPLGTKTVTMAAGETKHCSVPVNVGSVEKNRSSIFTIVATVNLNGSLSNWSTWHEDENDLSNNRNARGGKGYTCGNVLVERVVNFGLQILTGKYSDTAVSRSEDGKNDGGRTTGMVTCVITNGSQHHMFPTDDSGDQLTVKMQCAGGTEQTSPILCAPAKGTNTTWFSFTVPQASSVQFNGKLLWSYLEEHVNDDGKVYPVRVPEETVANESASAEVVSTTAHATPDTVLDKNSSNKQLVQTDASQYAKAEQYVISRPGYPRVAQWDQWQMDGSTFVLHRYALAGEIKSAKLTPMNQGEDTEYVNSKGQIASGSAFAVNYVYAVKTECSVSGDTITWLNNKTGDSTKGDYTLAQNAVARFPEFKYQLGGTNCRTLFFTDKSGVACTMQFAPNEKSDGQQRVHFTPLNMPDGPYKVALEAYDLWTPAGMIYVIAAPTLEIHGSVYDYNYMS